MNAAVTGGSGFLGCALLSALQARGDDVRALVRRPEAAAEVEALGATPVMGDLTKPGGCDELVRKGDTVFHAAARVDMSGHWRDFKRTTVDGTRRLLEAALPKRPRHFMYMSSGAVYSAESDPRGMCAGRTGTEPAVFNYYGRAKLEAEQLVQSECDRAGCPWTIMRLGFMFGAGNRALHRHFAGLARTRRLMIIGDGNNRIATLYIDDAIRAILAAADRPLDEGRTYDIANDEPVTQRQFLEATTDALGLRRPKRRIGRGLAFWGCWLAEAVSNVFGRAALISRAMVVLMSADQVVDSSRIRAELGWRPEVDFAEGMRRMAEWCRQSDQRPPAKGSKTGASHVARVS